MKLNIKLICSLFAVASCFVSLEGKEPQNTKKTVSASISIDAKDVVAPVNRKIMGHMLVGGDSQYIWSNDTPDYDLRATGHGVWDSKNERPEPKVVKLIKALRPGIIRYPGGSVAKNYNWKLVVGPLKDRQRGWHWGLVEFLTFCEKVGAEPQICLSEYVGGPEDQRDLVEFLNAPAIPKYPWAMKRAKWGHKKPFNVKYFELGNEPYDGNRRVIPRKQWDAKGYSEWAKKTAKLMRSVDPTIKLGLPAEGFAAGGSDLILEEVSPYVDFIVRHTYPISYAGNRALTPEEEDRVMRSCMAAAPQLEYNLKRSREHVKDITGRDIPIGVTEYNTMFMNEKPRAYRRSLGAGLFSIDYTFKMLKPENNVLLANYWQIFHGYWGSILPKSNLALLPPYYCYKIVGQHLGDKLLKSSVDCPKIDFEGFSHVKPANGDAHVARSVIEENLYSSKYVFLPSEGMKSPGLVIKKDGDDIIFTMDKLKGQNYPAFATIQVHQLPEEYRPKAGVAYEISFEASLKLKPGSGKINLGLGVMDGRGWDVAGSAIAVEGVMKPEWEKFTGTYAPLKDTPNIIILGRLLAGNAPVSGTMRVRNIKLKPVKPETLPAYDALSVLTTKKDGKVYILIINKYTDKKVTTSIDLKNFNIKSLTECMVSAPEAASVKDAFMTKEKKIKFKNNKFNVTLEPHSITAITANSK